MPSNRWREIMHGLMGMIQAAVEGRRDVRGHWSGKFKRAKAAGRSRGDMIVSGTLKTVLFGLSKGRRND